MYIVLSESVSTIHDLSHGSGVPRPPLRVQALSLSHSIVFSKFCRASSGYIFMPFSIFRTLPFHASSENLRNHWFSSILTWHFVVQRQTTSPVVSHTKSAEPLRSNMPFISSFAFSTGMPAYLPHTGFIIPV